MVAFLLMLAFFTNLNFITLASKVNVSLTAELQFNQNDIAELEKAQMYLKKIKHDILRKNPRRLNAKRQKNIKNNEFNEINDNVVTSDESKANMIEYPNFRNNPTYRKNEARKNKVNINVKQVTTYKQDKTRQNKNNIKHKNNTSSKTTGDQDRVTLWDIHIHDIQSKQIIRRAKPLKQNVTKTTTLTTTTKTTTEKTESTKTNGVQKLKDIHMHDIQSKQIIRKAKPLKQNTTKTTMLSTTTTKTTTEKTESTKTNGAQKLRDIHMHDIQSKQVIMGVKSKIIQSSAKTAKHTREPSARRHNVFTNLLTQENKKGSVTTTEKPKDVNKIAINDHTDIKDEEIDFSVKQAASEKYNNLNEYLKYKASENNFDKEVLEIIKSDLGTLFAIKSNPTSEKADSLQELEKAFGFDM
ncbi:uncharacterized protein LOC121736669 [Aricia agestis]|uniref:uncharacterized protein LOC121736669 n=1 Tax=Aricia agestis TaxID=91739 RepID=UPI001C20B087|nr:uncharacterized protein LOC121736669 [Aricia agestis]XP_041983939.1 uncharacterized protein LOC121736669 [Aricia agestis]XP_041983940.1 uncharacterized protein LOC121736669 [Aricia agestis]